MWLVLCWLVGIPKLVYHFFLTSILLMLFLCYKIFGTQQAASLSRTQLQEQLERRQRLILASGGQLRDKIKFAIMRGARGAMSLAQREDVNQNHNQQQQQQQDNSNPIYQHYPYHSNSQAASRRPNDTPRFYLASVAVFYALLIACCWPTETYCLEQDAAIIAPVAGIAKSVIKTVTLGEPLELNFDPVGLAKNFAYLTWRTGFPVSMPRGFVQKAQDFYNRVKTRVDYADVKDVQRKSLANLKLDLDDIVDSIVEEVRQSPDGLYTDYMQTRVNGVPLEDACTNVGIQLKAYGVDLTNYRNIAGMVLGLPVVPTVASAVVNVASLANFETMRNLTSTLNPLNSTLLLTHVPNSAVQSVSMVSNSIDNLRQQLPVQNVVQMPLSLLSSGQRFFLPQTAQEQERQPVFA